MSSYFSPILIQEGHSFCECFAQEGIQLLKAGYI